MTPDGRDVDFRCHHNHRTQSAAIECAGTIRKQIARGQSLHLVTRVRSTPASREAARQRELQQEADRQAKAALRAHAAEQRAQEQEARRQAKSAHRAEAAHHREASALQRTLQRQQRAAAQQQLQAQAPPSRHGQYREQPAQQQAEPWPPPHPDERWDRVHQQRAQGPKQRRHPRGWPVTGLIIGGAAVVLGAILAGAAGNNSRSALATGAGGVITVGVLALLICATAALWRRLQTGKRNEPYQPSVPYSQNIPLAPYRPPPPVNGLVGYGQDPYPGQRPAAYLPPTQPPPRSRNLPPWET